MELLSLNVAVILALATVVLSAAAQSPASNYSQRFYLTNDDEAGTRESYFGSVANGIKIKLTRNITVRNPYGSSISEPEISYFGVMALGSNQKLFNVVFDLGAQEIWVPIFYNIFERVVADNLHYWNGYDSAESRTGVYIDKNYKFPYRRTNFIGDLYEELLTLIEFATKEDAHYKPTMRLSFRQKFLAITETNDEQFRYKPYDGVIGLAPGQTSDQGIGNLLIQLRREMIRFISEQEPDARFEPDFGLIMGLSFNPDKDDPYGGELTLGGIDKSRFLEPVQSHRILSHKYWELALDRVNLHNTVVSCQNGCFARFDNGANSIVGPQRDVDEMRHQLNANYNQESNLWLVNCQELDNMPLLSFFIGGYSYRISSEFYTRAFYYKGANVCYLTIKSWDEEGWLLGTSFLSAFYTIYDFENRRIGIAQPRL